MPLAHRNSLDEIRASDKLPSPSGVALEILNLTADEDASSEQLEKVLVCDPALAGQILKFANCARVNTGAEVTTVRDAVVRLGMTLVRQLALGFSVLANARSGPCEAFDYPGFWTQSLAVAVGAQAVGNGLPRIDPDVAFTCGLLGRVGRLCLASVHPDDYAVVLRQWDGGSTDRLVALERERFSTDHGEVGAVLFADWGLPELFQEAVRFQSDPAAVNELPENRRTLPRLLHLANHLAVICAAPAEGRDALVEELLRRGTLLGIDEQAVTDGCSEALQEWKRMGETLDIIVGDVPPIAELVARARDEGDPEPSGPTAEARPRGNGLRILVSAANAADGESLGDALTADGHAVSTVDDGGEALRLALQSMPQIIIADADSPGLGGHDLCAALRRSEEAAPTYIILLADGVESEAVVDALAAGADDCLAKPVDRRLLAARLTAARRLIGLQERAERDRDEIRRIVAQLGVANRKLEKAALYDELTGLPNRRFAVDRLHQEWERCRRSGASLVVMLLDIDHFKRVNDNHGHDAGDVVLQDTARAMHGCLRASDVVCRFGGEEFLAICPDADLESATMLGDRIRQAVAENLVDRPAFKGSVTVSVGVAGLGPEIPSEAALLKLADQALYAAKDAGRNRVCYVGPQGS